MNYDFSGSFLQQTSKFKEKINFKIYCTIFMSVLLFIFYPASISSHTFAESNETGFSEPSDKNTIQIDLESVDTDGNEGNKETIAQNGLSNDTSNEGDDSQDDPDDSTERSNNEAQPDKDCLFDPSLTKCAPDEDGNCPDGFGLNEDGQCVPNGGCPDGYHAVGDDESGRCIPNSDGCPSRMIFRPGKETCGNKDDVCRHYPDLKECKDGNGSQDRSGKDSDVYHSGYAHGCSDAGISEESDRYINQPEKGPSNHTDQFMNGYYDGFYSCSKVSDNQTPIANAGPDKIITAGQSVNLDGTKSYDPDGKIDKYQWNPAESFAPGCLDITLRNENSPIPIFSASSTISHKCSSYYELVVTDDDGLFSSDRMTVSVTPISNQSEGVKMYNIHTIPNRVHASEDFVVAATISNNFDSNVQFTSSCDYGDLGIKFSKNIGRDQGNTCDHISLLNLGPHKSIEVDTSGLPFITENTGKVNSQVTFAYTINNISDKITKPFSFDILPKKFSTVN